MHDITNLEAGGCPAVFVASTEFINAAKVQSQGLGFDAAAVFVAHPIYDRTDSEIYALADSAFEAIVENLTSQGYLVSSAEPT